MTWSRIAFPLAALAASSSAFAQVAEECQDFIGPAPEGYDEQVQADFLANYTALATSYSAIHGPIPHEPGRGAVGVDIGIIPPLGCEKRFALAHTKTEDTNVTPAVPKIHIGGAFAAIGGKLVPYVSFSFVPPVPLFGTTNVILSGEVGVGMPFGEHFQLGARYNATLQKTVGEVVTPISPEDPAVEDLYIASTQGFDLLAGWNVGTVTPYVALGVLDASTFLYIGDDAIAPNNLHPYFGLVGSLGVDALVWDRFRVGGEFFAAPGGHSVPEGDDSITDVEEGAFSRYGNLYTGRFRFAYEF